MRNLNHQEQDQLAEYWFRLNFVPLHISVGGAGYGIPGPRGGYAPSNAMAINLLQDEFAEVLPPAVIEALSLRLHTKASWWEPAPPESSLSDIIDPAAVARVALERVEADLTKIGPGHNQGPALDPASTANALDQVQLGREGVASGASGKEIARSAAIGLAAIAGTLSLAFGQGVAKQAGENAEPMIMHGLAVLLDHMLQAASALLHWIASIPPGPLL